MVITACFLMVGCGFRENDNPGDGNPRAQQVTIQLSDRYPSYTAQDWVTYSDAVALVEVTKEQREAPSEDDVQLGEGTVPRTVTLQVIDILWSAPEGTPLPQTVKYEALGWAFHSGNTESGAPLVSLDRPRFESGQQYLVALDWEDERCYEGDGVIPGSWRGLGANSALPVTDGVIGVGEFGGQQRDLARAEEYAASLLEENSVAEAVTGEGPDDVRKLLAATEPGTPGDYGPQPSTC